MMKKRIAAFLLSLALVMTSTSAALAENTENSPEDKLSLAEITKLSRDNAQYDLTVASTNTDTAEVSISLSDVLGSENVPTENVAVEKQNESGDFAEIVTAIYFSEGAFKYVPAERPADGKTGTLTYTVSSDDYNDFTITINLKAQDTRAEIEDIEFEALDVDPDEWAGVNNTGYPLSDIAAAAFDDPSELTDGFEYHGVSFSENAQSVLNEIETYYTDDWDGYFIFSFEESIERGNTAWVRYEVSSDKYKPFGLILYFTVPKLDRRNASQAVNIDAFSDDRAEQSMTVSELLSGKNIPQKNLRLSYVSESDNFSSIISSIIYEDNALKYTPAENLNIGDSADITFKISSGDYEDFEATVFFTVIDGRKVHQNVSYNVSISYKNTDTSEKSLSMESIFGGADKLPAGLSLDLDKITVSNGISNILSSYTVSESGIVYSFKENPASSASARIEIPAILDNHKPFAVTINFNVSAKTASAFVVHFDTDGGSRVENKVVSRGSRLTQPAKPTKEGYVFDGWYPDKEFSQEYDFTRSVGRNFTLYAKWVPVASDTEKEDADSAGNTDTTDNIDSTDTPGNTDSTDTPVYNIVFTIDKKEAEVFGENVTYDVAPIIVNSRTMLSARYVAENLGANVEWDGSAGKGKVTITKGNTEIILYVGEMYAHVNGEKVELDVIPFIENSRTYYPARFIAERLGASVRWNEILRTVTVSTTEKPVWNSKFAE